MAATRICFPHCCCINLRECCHKFRFVFAYTHSRSCPQCRCQPPNSCPLIVYPRRQPVYCIYSAAVWHEFIFAFVVGGVMYYVVWSRCVENVGHVTLRLTYVEVQTWRRFFVFFPYKVIITISRGIRTGPVFAHGTTGAKRTVGAPPPSRGT
jgi:hypothetical protein